MDIVRCPVCGHGFSPSGRVCPNCHTRLATAPVPWFWIAVAAVLVIVAGVALYFLTTAG